MDQSPLEQQRDKIEAVREQFRKLIGHIFDNPKEIGIDDFIAKLDSYENAGLKFNREEIIKGIEEGFKIKNRGAFVAHILKVLEPIIILHATQPNIISKINRENTLNHKDNLKLSEVFYLKRKELNAGVREIYIHLPEARDYMTKDKIEDFKLEMIKGLVELAKIIKSYPNIKEVWMISPLVKTSKKRIKELGFTYVGEQSEEEKREYSPDEDNPVGKAFMTREDFLARYSTKD